jgi:benzoate/toluate 1,2-dioxygenase beta subunit
MIMPSQANYDPSRFSYYVTDAFYSELIEDFSDWQADDRAIEDAAERDLFRRLVEQEARILDDLLFEDWLKLFAPECAYWVPSTPERGDPRREIAVMFDDRRRLEDRVYRLRTGYAWSQRLVTDVARCCKRRSLRGRAGMQRMVRSNFIISEFWDNEIRTLSDGRATASASSMANGRSQQAGGCSTAINASAIEHYFVAVRLDGWWCDVRRFPLSGVKRT